MERGSRETEKSEKEKRDCERVLNEFIKLGPFKLAAAEPWLKPAALQAARAVERLRLPHRKLSALLVLVLLSH